MFNQNINDLLSFGVFFVIYEIVGLEFDREFKACVKGFIKGIIQIYSITIGGPVYSSN